MAATSLGPKPDPVKGVDSAARVLSDSAVTVRVPLAVRG